MAVIVKKQGKYTNVLMDKDMTTHSFFNYIFVQKSDLSDRQRKNVLLHEQFHADRWHSFDLLLVGFLSILQWFNPFIYLLKRALTETHEFQADQAVVDRGVDKLHYQQLLLAQSRSIVFAGLTSKFNQSLIKNRLKMMNRIKSNNSAVIKYFLLIPIVFTFSIVFSVSQENIDKSISEVVSYNPVIAPSDPFGLLVQNIKMTDNIELDSSRYIPSISPVDEKFLNRPASGYGMRTHPILKIRRMHAGEDFSAPQGTPVKAAANGIVIKADFSKTAGNLVVIDHGNEYSTKYFQLSEYIVIPEQQVKKGEVIGYVGSTGLSKAPHLHYEVWKDGKHVDPADYLVAPKE